MMGDVNGEEQDTCDDMMKLHCCNLSTAEATKSGARFYSL